MTNIEIYIPDHAVHFVLDVLRAPNHTWTRDVADQIALKTKPARIEEPGLWGVVEAGGYRWVRYSLAGYDDWVDLLGKQNEWDILIDPTLIRAGVTE